MDLKIVEELKILKNVLVQENVSLSEFTTFRLGGLCPCVVTCQRPDQLEAVIQRLTQADIPFVLIGLGSNILVSDQGVDCVVVRFVSGAPKIALDGEDLIVAASTLLDDVVVFALKQGLEGNNFASGIPGTVGGAVAGNAGAFGSQISNCLKSVEVLTCSGERKECLPSDLDFQYRDSALKRSGEIVLTVRFALCRGDRQKLFKEREEILNLRKEKHPDISVLPCAGSFFKNIEPGPPEKMRQSAGEICDRVGAKKMRCGGAAVFEKHANILVNSKEATAQDVYNLSQEIARRVKEEFGVNLVREVQLLGEFS